MQARVRRIPEGTHTWTVWAVSDFEVPEGPAVATAITWDLALRCTPHGHMWATFDISSDTLVWWLEDGQPPSASDLDRYAALTGRWPTDDPKSWLL